MREPTKNDAHRQAAMVNAYWNTHGIAAKAEVVIAIYGSQNGENRSIYGIRSSLTGHEQPGVRV